MNCRETEQVIGGYLDGELGLVQNLAVEQHLKDCPACAKAHREFQSFRSAMMEKSFYFDSPKGLEKRVRSALRQEARAESATYRGGINWKLGWLTVLTPFAAVAIVLLIAMPLLRGRFTEDRLAQEVLSAHVRSLMVNHKTDVASADPHTVKPWFDGKLDFAPPVNDFADRGFPQVGGRLDYLDDRPVAAVVYQRNKHFINLFMWPASSNVAKPKVFATLKGYNLLNWEESGMTFWAVSDLNRAELMTFAEMVK